MHVVRSGLFGKLVSRRILGFMIRGSYGSWHERDSGVADQESVREAVCLQIWHAEFNKGQA